jgi:hypothetical protein
VERQSIAGSCSSLLIKLGLIEPRLIKPGLIKLAVTDLENQAGGQSMGSQVSSPSHAQLLTGLEITAELVRSRLDRKPVRSAEITFTSKTAWAG